MIPWIEKTNLGFIYDPKLMMNIIHVKPNRFGNQYHGWDILDLPLCLINLNFSVLFLVFWNILPYLCSFTMCINTWFIIFGIKRRHDLKNTQGRSLLKVSTVRYFSLSKSGLAVLVLGPSEARTSQHFSKMFVKLLQMCLRWWQLWLVPFLWRWFRLG